MAEPLASPGSLGLMRSCSECKTPKQLGAGGVLAHGERLVQPSKAWPGSPILICHLTGCRYVKRRAVGGKMGCLNGRGDAHSAEGGSGELVGCLSRPGTR